MPPRSKDDESNLSSLSSFVPIRLFPQLTGILLMDYQQSHLMSNRPRHNSVPFHIPTNDYNVRVQSTPQHSYSSPGALNRSEYQRNFKECVREYGPKPQQPSLFLFGRDQFERCETREVHSISPESGCSDPNPRTHFGSNTSSHHNIKSPSSAPEFETNQKSSEAFRSPTLNTLTRQPSWLYEPLAQHTTNEPTTPTSAHTHRWPSGERKSPNVRSPNLQQKSPTSASTISRPQSRAHDVFNFPEVPNDLHDNHELPTNRSPFSSPRNLQKSDDEFELRGPQKRQKFFGMNENDHSSTAEHQQHQSMIAELKSRFQKLQEPSSKFNVPLPTPISPTMKSKPKSPQISPQHQPIPADPPSNQSRPKSHDPIMELKRILQSDSQVLPVIERFLQSNFKIDHEKTFDFKDVQESEIPLQHYWERMFEVSDGQKNATIKIENLLTIEKKEMNDSSPTATQFGLSTRSARRQLTQSAGQSKQSGFIPTHDLPFPQAVDGSSLMRPTQMKGRLSIDSKSSSSSTNELVLTEHQHNSPSWLTNLGSSPIKSKPAAHSTVKSNNDTRDSIRSEADLLQIVQRKVAKKIPLEWPELFLLKNSHCRYVLPKERQLYRLTQEAQEGRRRKELKAELTTCYKKYQELLERCVVIDDLYTQLAFLIMKAESFWYGARVCSDRTMQTNWYRASVMIYTSLLEQARQCLPANDKSLLTILHKLSTIMLESCYADKSTVQLSRQAIAAAERALEDDVNVKMERKLIKIKNALMMIETNILR